MARHIREGEFLAPYGMYSISLSDREHWDIEDCDWGGGGQYVGQPLKTAETLYDIGEADLAGKFCSAARNGPSAFPISSKPSTAMISPFNNTRSTCLFRFRAAPARKPSSRASSASSPD